MVRGSGQADVVEGRRRRLVRVEALPSFVREKMHSSDEFKGRVAHANNMSGGRRDNRPAHIGAELAANEGFAAATEVVPDEPAS
jgi:hypothetical protein